MGVLQFLVFLTVVFTVLGLIHYYLWRKLIRNTTTTRKSRRIGTWTVLGVVALVVVTFIAEDALPPGYAQLLAWPGYLWVALMFYLLVILAVLEVPALAARLVIRRRHRAAATAGERVLATVSASAHGAGAELRTVDASGGGDADPATPGGLTPTGESRRVFLARTIAVTAGVAAVGIVGGGVGSALGPPRVRRVQIPLTKLGRSADGLRIAVVSDIHLGPLLGVDHTSRIVGLINGLDAHVVAIVGDLVDGTVEDLGPAAAPLADLRSRYGSFFVTGNHEYFSGHQPWVEEELPELGLRVLRNERVELPAGLDLAGVNDINGRTYGDGPDLTKAMAERDPSRPVVLLAHQPAIAAEAARHGVDLQLSGHTHGGQMVPFNLVVRLSGQPVVSGLGEVDGMPVFVTNGAGFWGPPVRVGAPPEITLVELRSAQ